MKRSILFLLMVLLAPAIKAQTDSSQLRISLLTIGPGHEEIYEPFGHTAIRIIDTLNGTDLVYNYGTFSYGEPNFELKFMQGKLLYYISVSSFNGFMDEYVESGRKAEEQVLQLGGKEKEEIYAFLQYNLQPGQKYYKYDFFFDNCATRIRDIFPKVFGEAFRYGPTLPPGAKISFRDIINQYLYREHFERFGINLLLGSRIDRYMSDEDVMFLPDYLRDGMANAMTGTQKVAGPTEVLLEGGAPPPAGVNGGFVAMIIVLVLTAAGLMVRRLHSLGRVMQALVMLVNGLLGCLMLVMWFGTDHQACQENLNILWALPTSLLIAFRRKRVEKYAFIAMILLFVSFLLHLLGIQKLPLTELWPWLLSLLLIYGTIYRNAKKEDAA